jgi:hypothetical protein
LLKGKENNDAQRQAVRLAFSAGLELYAVGLFLCFLRHRDSEPPGAGSRTVI